MNDINVNDMVNEHLSKRKGRTITSTKKSGIELGLDDIKAGRIYHASNAEEMMVQMHSQGE